MNLDLTKTLNGIEKLLKQSDIYDIQNLQKAYEQTLRLRSQLISVIYDNREFIYEKKTETKAPKQIRPIRKDMIELVINEPLPALKELTTAVEEHWVSMIHNAIKIESGTGIPKYKRAFVLIDIITPRGTNNKQVWDTSNRAVNLVINNLKGIFFEDDNYEHMAFGVVANWGEHGKTIIRICELDKLFECAVFSVKTEKP